MLRIKCILINQIRILFIGILTLMEAVDKPRIVPGCLFNRIWLCMRFDINVIGCKFSLPFEKRCTAGADVWFLLNTTASD